MSSLVVDELVLVRSDIGDGSVAVDVSSGLNDSGIEAGGLLYKLAHIRNTGARGGIAVGGVATSTNGPSLAGQIISRNSATSGLKKHC